MSAIHSSSLTAEERRLAVLGPNHASLAEKHSKKEEQEEEEERKLREQYEQLIRQLDKKPADAPRPADISRQEKSPPRD
jgi:hypothetical protein